MRPGFVSEASAYSSEIVHHSFQHSTLAAGGPSPFTLVTSCLTLSKSIVLRSTCALQSKRYNTIQYLSALNVQNVWYDVPYFLCNCGGGGGVTDMYSIEDFVPTVPTFTGSFVEHEYDFNLN